MGGSIFVGPAIYTPPTGRPKAQRAKPSAARGADPPEGRLSPPSSARFAAEDLQANQTNKTYQHASTKKLCTVMVQMRPDQQYENQYG